MTAMVESRKATWTGETLLPLGVCLHPFAPRSWIFFSFFKKCIYLFWLNRVLVVACGMGLNPAPTALAVRGLSHWTTREVPQVMDFLSVVP